jgi:hypothetical protein
MPCLLSADSREEKKNGLRLNLFGSTHYPNALIICTQLTVLVDAANSQT